MQISYYCADIEKKDGHAAEQAMLSRRARRVLSPTVARPSSHNLSIWNTVPGTPRASAPCQVLIPSSTLHFELLLYALDSSSDAAPSLIHFFAITRIKTC